MFFPLKIHYLTGGQQYLLEEVNFSRAFSSAKLLKRMTVDDLTVNVELFEYKLVKQHITRRILFCKCSTVVDTMHTLSTFVSHNDAVLN